MACIDLVEPTKFPKFILLNIDQPVSGIVNCGHTYTIENIPNLNLFVLIKNTTSLPDHGTCFYDIIHNHVPYFPFTSAEYCLGGANSTGPDSEFLCTSFLT